MADDPPPLPDKYQERQWEAATAKLEADAESAKADAATAQTKASQAKIAAIIPDFTKTNTDAVDDKTTTAAFAGPVVYRALNVAAETAIDNMLAGNFALSSEASILVTSDDDLLKVDLTRTSVSRALKQLNASIDVILSIQEDGTVPTDPIKTLLPPVVDVAHIAAAAIPSVIALFSSKTTVKDETVTVSDLAAASAVMQVLRRHGPDLRISHDTFRLGPVSSPTVISYQELLAKRTKLSVMKMVRQPAAGVTATPMQTAIAALIDSAITTIGEFVTTVNATTAGSRSPLDTATLMELMTPGEPPEDADPRDKTFAYVLLVKSISARATEMMRDRNIGHDTFTTIADATISYLLLDVTTQDVIRSGTASGSASVFGQLGQEPQYRPN